MHPQNRTAININFATAGSTLPPIATKPNYNTATVTIPLRGAPEGVHQASVAASYEGEELGAIVNFEIQIGASTAPARLGSVPAAPSQNP